jgi:hypothetical protein
MPCPRDRDEIAGRVTTLLEMECYYDQAFIAVRDRQQYR